jgi:UDP-N-acetylglucosamine 2-epimerase (non-hydrolysing)
LTDAISDILFVTEPSGLTNLTNEGINGEKVHFVGNVMIDTLELHRKKVAKSTILDDLNLRPKEYCVVTLHRPSNVDECQTLERILDALAAIQEKIKVIFPAHPRTVKQLETSGLAQRVRMLQNIMLIEPLGYLDFLRLMSESRVVITDSGGIQEETTVLGIPCLTVRKSTERPITITEGTNTLVGTDTSRILTGYKESLNQAKPHTRPSLWDGKASERIVRILLDVLCNIQIRDKGFVKNPSG